MLIRKVRNLLLNVQENHGEILAALEQLNQLEHVSSQEYELYEVFYLALKSKDDAVIAGALRLADFFFDTWLEKRTLELIHGLPSRFEALIDNVI
jgi:hypothetical protein